MIGKYTKPNFDTTSLSEQRRTSMNSHADSSTSDEEFLDQALSSPNVKAYVVRNQSLKVFKAQKLPIINITPSTNRRHSAPVNIETDHFDILQKEIEQEIKERDQKMSNLLDTVIQTAKHISKDSACFTAHLSVRDLGKEFERLRSSESSIEESTVGDEILKTTLKKEHLFVIEAAYNAQRKRGEKEEHGNISNSTEKSTAPDVKIPGSEYDYDDARAFDEKDLSTNILYVQNEDGTGEIKAASPIKLIEKMTLSIGIF
jgi:hypothetical protein